MILKKLVIENFRNYQLAEIEPYKNLNFFIGENGQGKTNLLEMVYYLALGRSFRNSRDEEILNWNESFFRIKGILTKKDIQRDLEIEIVYEKGNNKRIKINGVNYHKVSELLGVLQVSTFIPEDLSIVKDGPNKRRRYLDLEISQLKKTYYLDLLNYYKVLKQRNILLKDIFFKRASTELLDIWDEQLITLGSKITIERINFLKILVPLARNFQWSISKEKERLDISYNSLLINNPYEDENKIKENYKKELLQNRSEELKKGISLIGPHRDDLIFYLNGQNLRKYGSQGQQRSAILALKIAELKLFFHETGEYPILLLDDVMSELDDQRRNYLVEMIRENKIQTLITGANQELKEKSLKNEVFEVIKGEINLI